MRLIIVSGISGSGKSVALDRLEDLGYYCIDNIPAQLLKVFVGDVIEQGRSGYESIAVGIDARNRTEDLKAIPDVVRELKQTGIACEVLYLTADDEVLMKRYSETRRPHPLGRGGGSLRDSITLERDLLSPMAEHADLVIDTSRTGVHDLRDRVRVLVQGDSDNRITLLFESFGFKYGVPKDADFMFDLRCLPNPYWDASLRAMSGLDQPVADFLASQEQTARMISDLIAFLERWLPEFSKSDRSYVTVALGCTGGQHRSVYVAEQLAAHFRAGSAQVEVLHSELTSRT
jgi:RNase adapter protein RapZ